ncbi:MAG: glycoside hydrolase family 9 protein, partial [Cohnella sp.]|nr:glycoside hydrolase family 9 protein [Cohnella sp.]
VSQAGYSAADYKGAKVAATEPLSDTSYVIATSSGTVASGNLIYDGFYWNKHVYTAEFTSLTASGTDYKMTTNGVSSYPFQIQPNVWDGYKDEMTGFYRLQRSGVATADVYPPGYSSIAPSRKLFHAAGHLDDGKSFDGTTHYDLTGGWYDAGDYGKYGGNQWVGTEIALAYIRHADAPEVKYDNDGNGIPDLIDEAVFGSEYLIKWVDQVGGLMYDLPNQGGFLHPEKVTDNIPGTADDRQLIRPNIGGSAKAAATLAATARAIRAAVAEGDIDPGLVASLEDFADDCLAAALDFYAYVVAHPTDPLGGYATTRGGLANSKLIADVELFLLTGNPAYHTAATSYVNSLAIGDLLSTNYWDMRPMALAEFYPAADSPTQTHIQALLKSQADTFLTLADDTPYGVLNQFKDFGVNEPHASYVGDMLRYYELFGDPAVLRAVQKGMYWIFGANPWNISWVSGIGTDFADFPHTRLDEVANTAGSNGAVFPGAMFSGPLLKDTLNKRSVSPWYQDRALYQDDTNQWRYNEFSVSIQAGLLYSVLAMSAIDGGSAAGTTPAELLTLSPVIGDYVRGNVTLFAKPDSGVSNIEYLRSGVYNPMTVSRGVYSATIDESAAAPYATRRIDVRGVDANGNATYSATHYSVAPPLPDPAHLSLYDDFGGNGLWGVTGSKPAWVNWWNQDSGNGSFEKVTVDGRTAGKFMQTAESNKSYAKFQPWHNAWDLTGYRYVNFSMKNPGYANLQMKVDFTDGSNKSYNLSGGWISVPNTWTDYQWDLNALTPAVNKDGMNLAIWLRQTSGTYAELLIDEIKATNVASGTAPTLTAVGVNATTGNTDTPFTFTATYTDADNEAPLVMELLIDGVIRRMAPVDAGDTNYTDGKAYAYTTKLTEGVHSFYVNTTDTTSNAVSTALQSGPSVFDTLFEDDFADGNADGWTSTSGTWNVSSGQYRGQATSLNSYSVAGDSGWTDYTFQADVNVTNNSGGNKDAGIVFRYTDENNHYILMLKNNDKSGRKMELLSVEGGVKTSLGFANPSVAPDTFYTYRIEVYGDDIKVYQNNALILSATDDTHAAGKIGARVYANTLAVFDNITVTP